MLGGANESRTPRRLARRQSFGWIASHLSPMNALTGECVLPCCVLESMVRWLGLRSVAVVVNSRFRPVILFQDSSVFVRSFSQQQARALGVFWHLASHLDWSTMPGVNGSSFAGLARARSARWRRTFASHSQTPPCGVTTVATGPYIKLRTW